MIIDNLSVHKGERFRELIEVAGCEVHYPPPYSGLTKRHRGDVLDAQEPLTRGGSQNPGSALVEDNGQGARRGHREGCERFLRALRILCCGSTFLIADVTPINRGSPIPGERATREQHISHIFHYPTGYYQARSRLGGRSCTRRILGFSGNDFSLAPHAGL